MSLAVTTEAALAEHLRQLQIAPGTDLLVHSRLTAFGSIPGGVEAAYRAIRSVVGDEATIAVPAYSLRPPSGEWFDPKLERWERQGVLSEYVRQLPDAVRTACPMHSHAVIGPKAARLAEVSGDVAFGPGSDFDAFEQLGFETLYLGCGFPDASTFSFHVEACCGNVPYRHWLELDRPARDPDYPGQMRKVRYYGRLGPEYEEDLEVVRYELERQGILRSARCPYGTSYAIDLGPFRAVLTALLEHDPSALLAKKS